MCGPRPHFVHEQQQLVKMTMNSVVVFFLATRLNDSIKRSLFKHQPRYELFFFYFLLLIPNEYACENPCMGCGFGCSFSVPIALTAAAPYPITHWKASLTTVSRFESICMSSDAWAVSLILSLFPVEPVAHLISCFNQRSYGNFPKFKSYF